MQQRQRQLKLQLNHPDGSEPGDQDDDDQDEDLECIALTTATRVSTNATGAIRHTQLASRQRRLGKRSALSATSAVISVTQGPGTLSLGHGTAPYQSGVVQQEAGQADPVSIAYGSTEQCDRALVPQQSGIEQSGSQHTSQHAARLNTTARDLIRGRFGGKVPGHGDHPTMGVGHPPEGSDYHRVSPLR